MSFRLLALCVLIAAAVCACSDDDRRAATRPDGATGASDGGAEVADGATRADASALDGEAERDGGPDTLDAGDADAGDADAGLACDAPLSACGRECVDLRSDPAHCGGCAVSCPTTHTCLAGACRETCGDRVICPTSEPPPFDRICTSPEWDPDHCGACGNACPVGQACVDGACSATCPGTDLVCNRVCTDTETNPAHCGACGNLCPRVGAGIGTLSTCTAGTCGYRCGTGYGDCDGDGANGCETALDENDASCGACGITCSADRLCSDGSCVLPTRVFVTSSSYDGDLASLGGPSAICQSVATAAGLSGTWRAWVSGPFSVAGSFPHSSDPYVRMDGVRIADDWADLTDGTLDAPIDVDETGATVPSGTRAWTGTQADGTQPATGTNDCLDWTEGSDSTSGRYGSTSHTTSWWSWYTDFPSTLRCNARLRLYCFGR